MLVNAIYLKAPWAKEFERATKPLPFQVNGGEPVECAHHVRQGHLGYAKRDGYQVDHRPLHRQ